MNQRFATVVTDDLGLLPADALAGHHTDPNAKRLRDSLLGSEPSRQLSRTRATVPDLDRREHTTQKTFTMTVQGPLDAGDLDQVDAGGQHSGALTG